jgi:VWFA-related protein
MRRPLQWEPPEQSEVCTHAGAMSWDWGQGDAMSTVRLVAVLCQRIHRDPRPAYDSRRAPPRGNPPRRRGPRLQGRACRIAALLFACGVAVFGQEEPISERAFFAPVEVSLVNVDVFAADLDGRPVAGLDSSDFEILEDGEPVTVTHFYAAPGISRDRSRAAVGPFEAAREVNQDLHLIVYFDDSNLAPERRSTAIEALEDFLRRLPAGTEMMIANWGGNPQLSRTFTSDVDRVTASLEELKQGGSHSAALDRDRLRREMQTLAEQTWRDGSPLPDDRSLRPLEMTDFANSAAMGYLQHIRAYAQAESHRAAATIEDLERLVRSVAGTSGRKAVVTVSDGIEANPGAELYDTWQQIFAMIARGTSVDANSEAERYNLAGNLAQLAQHANTSRVTIYTLLPRGERPTSSSGADQEGGVTLIAGFDAARSFKGGHAEVELARATGGRRLVNDRRLARELSDLASELDGYYSLAFRPDHVGDGRYHHIRVRITDRAVTLRHRDGYRDTLPVDRISDRTLTAAALGIIDNPLGISANSREQQPREGGLFLVPIVINVPLSQLSLLPHTTDHEGRVSILVAVQDDRGGLSGVQRREYPVKIPNDQFLSALSQDAEFIMGLVMREGPQRVGVGVRDELGNVDSTVTLDLHVGDHDP